jgi:hypothetical protein
LVKSHQFDLLWPYHIPLLFHNIVSDTSVELLSEFAWDHLAPKLMLVNVTFLRPLFSRLMTTDPRSGTLLEDLNPDSIPFLACEAIRDHILLASRGHRHVVRTLRVIVPARFSCHRLCGA